MIPLPAVSGGPACLAIEEGITARKAVAAGEAAATTRQRPAK